MSEATARGRRHGFRFWGFVVLMLALTGLWIGLGAWQLDRLHWKESLIARVSDRLTQTPFDLPPAGEWSSLDLDVWGFHPVTASGRFINDQTVLVFTSLAEAKGKYSGAGYWVMTPYRTGGGVVFVNRGFVPQSSGPAFAHGRAPPPVEQSITGIALAPESVGPFTPAPDSTNRIEWVRDPTRLAAMAGVTGPVFGLTIDLPAGEAGALPQGGETVVEFPNNHLGYALTWFGFALLTPALLFVWVWRQIRPQGPDKGKPGPAPAAGGTGKP